MNHLLQTYAEKTKSVPGVNIHLNIMQLRNEITTEDAM
jgi:hypothetical protein